MKNSQQWIDNIQKKAVVHKQLLIKKRRTIFGVSAGGAALSAILALALLSQSFLPFTKPSNQEKFVSSLNTENASDEIPFWYEPGDLTVNSLLSLSSENNAAASIKDMAVAKPSYAVTANKAPVAQNTGNNNNNRNAYVVLPENAEMKQEEPRDANYVELESFPEYPGGQGIYFNISENKTFCFSDITQKKAKENGLMRTDDKIQMYYKDPLSGNSLFYIQVGEEVPTELYFCNIYDGRLIKFPISLMKMHGPSRAVGGTDRNYLALWVGNRKGEMHIVDMSSKDLSSTNISNIGGTLLDAFGEPNFSDNSRYIYYNYSENGSAYDKDLVPYVAIYNIENKTTVFIRGTVERFIDGDSKVIVITKNGGVILDCETGQDVTAETTLEDWQKYRVRVVFEGNYSNGSRITADLVSLFEDIPDIVLVQHAGAVYPSDEYVYIYMPGDNFIICRKTVGNESFKVPIDESFVREISNVDITNQSISFYITISPDKSKLLLCASISRILPHEKQNSEFRVQEIGRLFRTASCLEDLKDYIEAGKTFKPYIAPGNGPEMFDELGALCVVEGNGYTALIVFGDAFPNAFVAVEDYRDKTFSLYSPYLYNSPRSRPPWLIPPELYNGGWEDTTLGTKPYRKTLADSADQKKTLALLSGVKRIEPYYDYADFYTNGELDEKKAEKWFLRKEQAHTAGTIWLNDYSSMQTTDGGFTIYNGVVSDRNATEVLLAKLANVNEYFSEEQGFKLGFPHTGSTKNNTGEISYRFQFFETKYPEQWDNMCELQIGKLKNGKYFIYTYAGYAYITADLYKELTTLCKKLYSSAELQ